MLALEEEAYMGGAARWEHTKEKCSSQGKSMKVREAGEREDEKYVREEERCVREDVEST